MPWIPQLRFIGQEHCGAKPAAFDRRSEEWLDLANQIGRRLFDPYALVAPFGRRRLQFGEQRIGIG